MHKIISAHKCNNSARLAIAVLLLIFFSPIVTNIHWSVDLQAPPASQNAALLTSASMDCVVSGFRIDRRSNLKSFDGSFSYALILNQSAVNSFGKSPPFFTEYNTRLTHRADRTAIPIRASPIQH